MTAPRKVKDLNNIGNIADGDTLVGERSPGTTVLVTVTGVAKLAGIEAGAQVNTVNSVNGKTGTVILNSDDISDTSQSHKFTNAADISRLASTSGTNTGDQTISLTGDVTGSGSGSFATTISNGAVTLAKQANMATSSLVYRRTAGTGIPEINTLATLKSDLGLAGTNSGDQTITLLGDVTGSGTGSFAATISNTAVTYAKIQNVSATARLLGRNSPGAGSVEELTASTAKTMLSLDLVENTALSTWAGSINLTTLGTITTGTWTGTTIAVANGGSGRTSATAYAVIVGGTTSTGAHQSVASGSTGQILQSAGNAAVPTWSTPTYPSASGTSRKILVSDGTNIIYSTETYGVPGASGKLMQSDGTNWTASTATWPTAATNNKFIIGNGTNYVESTSTIPSSAGATALKHLKSDGTNYVLTTATISDTPDTAGKVLISDGTNWITSTPTFPNASATAGKRIKSDGTNWVASSTTLPDSGTSRKMLVGDGTNYVESTETWATPGTSGNLLTSDGTNWISSAQTGLTQPQVMARISVGF